MLNNFAHKDSTNTKLLSHAPGVNVRSFVSRYRTLGFDGQIREDQDSVLDAMRTIRDAMRTIRFLISTQTSQKPLFTVHEHQALVPRAGGQCPVLCIALPNARI